MNKQTEQHFHRGSFIFIWLRRSTRHTQKTLADGGRCAQEHAQRVFRVISAPVSNNHSRVNVCTPTSLARVGAFLGRAQTTTTRVKEGERRRARRSKGRNGVWEKWKEEGGPGIGSANRNSPETGDELQKWDLRQMPSFSKELRPSAPLENTVIREGEAGVCQAQDLSVCVCRVALGHKPCHRTWPWGAAIRLPICWVKYRCCIRAEGLQLAPIKQVSVHLAALRRPARTFLAAERGTTCHIPRGRLRPLLFRHWLRTGRAL